MAFIRIPGIIGKVYVPDKAGPRKHNCKDCFVCQMCSDSRCQSCLKHKAKCQNARPKKTKKAKRSKNKGA